MTAMVCMLRLPQQLLSRFVITISINGRQETLTFGRNGVGGITLAEAREQLSEANGC